MLDRLKAKKDMMGDSIDSEIEEMSAQLNKPLSVDERSEEDDSIENVQG